MTPCGTESDKSKCDNLISLKKNHQTSRLFYVLFIKLLLVLVQWLIIT